MTNFAIAREAAWYYRQRFHIKTLISDYKSRDFWLDCSHISNPKRMARLLLASALAYLCLIYLGTGALAESWHKVFYRTERCDLSLFSLGLNLLGHFLKQVMPLPVAFHL